MEKENVNDDLEKEKYRNELYEDYKYSVESFDKQALLISGGALGLSLSFIKDIVPLDEAECVGIFISALIFFVISIALGFVAHCNSMAEIEKQIRNIDEGKSVNDKPDTITRYLNRVITFFVVLGIILMVTYSAVNIAYKANSHDEIKKDIPTLIQMNINTKN